MRKTKIVCTLGPSSNTYETIRAMIHAGMDVARLNFSHGDHASHEALFLLVRRASEDEGKPVAVLGDLCGPKIRLGRFVNKGTNLEAGHGTVLTTRDVLGTAELMPHSYLPLAQDVAPGDPILLNDGLVRLRVERVADGDVRCRVEVGGWVGDKKGMNLPGSKTSAPAVTEKDFSDIELARRLGFDFLALSFVRKPQDVVIAKNAAGGIPVIAKVEKPEAVDDLEGILAVADGLMVARGDLGVEYGHEKVPVIQKKIILSTRPHAKPVITATQMLESMTTSPTPTRAEASDVANAVLDGTDAVMLSGETASGSHPVLVVETMARIINEVEESGFAARWNCGDNVAMFDQSFSSAIADAVTSAARTFPIKAMAVYTESGKSAALVSAERPKCAIVAFSRHPEVQRRLALFWGVLSLAARWVKGVRGVVEQAETELVDHKLAQADDVIAITFGMRLQDEPFQTNMLKFWKVRQDRTVPLDPAVREQ